MCVEKEFAEVEIIDREIVEEGSPWWGPWTTIGFTLALVAACLFTDVIATVVFVIPMVIDSPKVDPDELIVQLESSGLLLSVGTFLRAVCCVDSPAIRRLPNRHDFLHRHPAGRRPYPLRLALCAAGNAHSNQPPGHCRSGHQNICPRVRNQDPVTSLAKSRESSSSFFNSSSRSSGLPG